MRRLVVVCLVADALYCPFHENNTDAYVYGSSLHAGWKLRAERFAAHEAAVAAAVKEGLTYNEAGVTWAPLYGEASPAVAGVEAALVYGQTRRGLRLRHERAPPRGRRRGRGQPVRRPLTTVMKQY